MREPGGLDGLRERARDLMNRGTARESEQSQPGPSEAPPSEGHGLWDRVEEASTIAPIHGDPSMAPANEPWEVAMMAGWGDVAGEGRGHDALDGVEDLLLGKVDAMDELRVDSGTGGTPLQLGRSEDLDGSIDPEEELSYTETQDWCSHL